MWQLRTSGSKPDPILVEVVKMGFSEPRGADIQKKYADFAEAVWRASGESIEQG